MVPPGPGSSCERIQDQAGSPEHAPSRGTPRPLVFRGAARARVGTREPGASPLHSPRPFAAVNAGLPLTAEKKRQPVCSGSSYGRSPLAAQLCPRASAAHRQS